MGSLLSHYPFGKVAPQPPLECSDFQPINNDNFKRDEDNRHRHAKKRALLRWTIIFAIGVVTACLYTGIHNAIDAISEARFEDLAERMKEDEYGHGWAIHFLSSLVLVITATLIVIAIPLAGGSGLPEILAMLNGVNSKALLSFPTGLAKTIGLPLAVASGLALG